MADTAKAKKSLKDQAQELIQSLVDAVDSMMAAPSLQPIPIDSRSRRPVRPMRMRRR